MTPLTLKLMEQAAQRVLEKRGQSGPTPAKTVARAQQQQPGGGLAAFDTDVDPEGSLSGFNWGMSDDAPALPHALATPSPLAISPDSTMSQMDQGSEMQTWQQRNDPPLPAAPADGYHWGYTAGGGAFGGAIGAAMAKNKLLGLALGGAGGMAGAQLGRPGVLQPATEWLTKNLPQVGGWLAKNPDLARKLFAGLGAGAGGVIGGAVS